MLAILAGASGQLIGGVVVTKAKLTVSGMLKFCALSSAVAACTTVIFTKTCPDTSTCYFTFVILMAPLVFFLH